VGIQNMAMNTRFVLGRTDHSAAGSLGRPLPSEVGGHTDIPFEGEPSASRCRPPTSRSPHDLVNTWQLKRRDVRVQNGGAPVIDSGKATVDRRIKLTRVSYFLAIAAEGGCNIGEAPALTLPA